MAIRPPTTTPTPTPTAEEIAASRLSEIVPWFENPPADSHGFVAELLIDLWLTSADLGNEVAGFPWVTDDVTGGERNFVAALGRIAHADLELAKTVADRPCVSDDVKNKERVTIQVLDRIASEDIELARRAVDFHGAGPSAGALGAGHLVSSPKIALLRTESRRPPFKLN